jgi:nicotinate-nucleotide adenylyltransferase
MEPDEALVTTGILGGIFDPPHNGHVALARAALEQLPIDRLLVLVAADPGHREVFAGPEDRLRLAQAAFDDLGVEVVLDHNAFTVDAVRSGRFGDALFVVGADEGAAFPTWKEPEEVLRSVRLAVGTRSGYPPPDLARYGDRVVSFELESPAVSSTEVRERASRGAPLAGFVPHAVEAAISEIGLYRGYTTNEPEDRKSH